jgi:hypothetical protein
MPRRVVTEGRLATRPARTRTSAVRRRLREAWQSSRPLTVLALAALAAGAVLATRHAVRLLSEPGISRYKAPQFWLDYSDGFVRRGLPGEVLSWFTGGSPTFDQVVASGVAMSLVGALAVVPLALAVARRAPGGLRPLLAFTLLVTSPLTLPLLLHDVGRFDAVGVVLLVALACASGAWERVPLWVGATAAGAMLAVACATQELFFGLLAPVVLGRTALLAGYRELGRTRQRILLAGVLAPGALLTAASALVTPGEGSIAVARFQARNEGVQAPDELGDALDAVDSTVVENLSFFGLFPADSLARTLAVWAVAYLLTALVLGRVLGRGAGRRYGPALLYYAALAGALSVAGVDFRRWWGLALLGLAGTVVLTRHLAAEREAPAWLRRLPLPVAVAGLAVLVVGGMWLWDAPVFPDR